MDYNLRVASAPSMTSLLQRRGVGTAILGAAGFLALLILGLLGVLHALSDPRRGLLFGISCVCVGLALTLAHRREPGAVVALFFGLGFGGGLWAEIVLQQVNPGKLVEFLQDHAFDYVAAGGLLAATLYLVANRDWYVRLPWGAGVMALIAFMTAQSGHAPPDKVIQAVVTGLLSGGVVSLLMQPIYGEIARSQKVDR